MSSILITGAAGTVGREVVAYLIQNNISFISASHHAEQISEQEVYLDLEKPETYPDALAGIERIFLMRPPQIVDAKRYFQPFVEVARQQRVRQIVFLSVMGAEYLKFAPHAQIERYIQQSGIGYTFLRPSFFMQNLVTQHLDELLQDNELYIPAGKSKSSLIDTRDIGEAAALCLLDEKYLNKAYTLTGSESLSYDQVAQIMAEELGRPIRYSRPSLWQFRKRMLAKGIPAEYVMVMLSVYLIAILGIPRAVKPDLAHILGSAHAPKTVRDFVRDYRERF